MLDFVYTFFYLAKNVPKIRGRFKIRWKDVVETYTFHKWILLWPWAPGVYASKLWKIFHISDRGQY